MKNLLQEGDLIQVDGEFWHIVSTPRTEWHERFFFFNRIYLLTSLIDPTREMHVSEKYMNKIMREQIVANEPILCYDHA